MPLGSQLLRWQFIVANVLSSILGTHFLRRNNLLVNVRYRRLLDSKLLRLLTLSLLHYLTSVFSLVSRPTNPFTHMIQQYPHLTEPTFTDFKPKQGVENFIKREAFQSYARYTGFILKRLVKKMQLPMLQNTLSIFSWRGQLNPFFHFDSHASSHFLGIQSLQGKSSLISYRHSMHYGCWIGHHVIATVNKRVDGKLVLKMSWKR